MMTRYFLLLFFITHLTIECSAQTTNFLKTFSTTQELAFFNLTNTYNSGYVVCGYSHGFDGGDFVVLKTDSNGNEEWRYINNQYDGDYYDNYFNKIIETSDHSYIAAGEIWTPAALKNILYAKIDSAGNLIWKKQISNIAISDFGDLLVGDDSTILLTASTIAGTLVIKTNYIGDTLWQRTIPLQNGQAFAPQGTLKIGSNYFISGKNNFTGSHATFKIMKIDSIGNLLWANEIYDSLSVYQFCSLRIQNDSLLVNLNQYTDSSGIYHYKTKFFDLQSNLILTKSIIDQPYKSNLLKDSSFVHSYAGVNDTLFACERNFFNSTTRLFRGFEAHFAETQSILEDKNKSIIFAGYIDDGANTNSLGFLMRFNKNSIVGISDLQVLNKIKIFPNPNSEYLYIQVDQALLKKEQEYTVKIYDSVGRLVYEADKIKDNQHSIITKNLKGEFFYKVLFKDTFLSGKLIIY